MAKDFDLEAEYNSYAKKYNLPSFNKINESFELYFIEKKEFLLHNVRRRIHDRLAFFARILEGVIFPNAQSIVSVMESKFFSEEEKNSMSNLYKKLVALERKSNRLDVFSTEKENALFINELFNEWEYIKKQMLVLLDKLEESWKKEESSSEEDYFG